MRTLYTRCGPATTPEVLKGSKILMMNNPVEARVWRAPGTIPTPMNFGEEYQALQSRVLHAAENAPAVIVLGMIGSVFTPTEAASVDAVYPLGICLFLYRRLQWRELSGLFAQTTIQFLQVLFCVAGAAILGWVLAFYRVPDVVTCVPVTRVLKLLHVMIIALVAVVLLCAFVPGIVLVLPRLLVPGWL